jgi:predicted permease
MTSRSRPYDWLLRIYPAWWRVRFEADMREAFAAEHADARAGGIAALCGFWIRTGAQALWFGLTERWRGSLSLRSFLAVDWRAAIRALRAAPVVTTMAVISLALGIGANTALFSILNSLLLRPLPVSAPHRLVLLQEDSITHPIWEQIRHRQAQLIDGIAAWSTDPVDLSTGGRTDIVSAAWVSPSLFEVLELKMALGRSLTEMDNVRHGAPDGPVAVITSGFWERRFGRRPDVIGRTIPINRVPFTIVGVLGAGFNSLDVGTDLSILVPIASDALIRADDGLHLDSRSSWWLHVIGRLKPGQSIDDATAAIRGVQPQIREATIPPNWPLRDQASYLTTPFEWKPAATGRSPLRDRYERPLSAILAVVGAVLLIACANIASLLLSRAQARRREMSLRLALGASRGRLARQLLVESLLLSASGALLGLLVAQWGSALLVQQLSTYTDAVFLDLTLDWRVLGFTTGVAVLTALLFGIAPALSAFRVAPVEALKEAGRAVTGGSRFGVRQLLVVVQVALSLTLVVAAGLFVNTFVSLTRVPLGFDPQPLTVVQIDVSSTKADAGERLASFDAFRAAAAALPGVVQVSASALTPMSDDGWNAPVEVADGISLPERRRLDWVNVVSPEYFDTYGMRLREGRGFTAQDRTGSPRVMIVNEAFVRRRIGEGPVIGRIVTGDIEGRPVKTSYEIVGVVNDAVYHTTRRGVVSTMYVPLAQLAAPDPGVALTIKTSAGVTEMSARQLVDALVRVDPNAGLSMRSFREQIDATLTRERVVAMLSAFFGALALLMVSLSLYGVTAFWIGRRRAEIGIRIALGAHPGHVVRLVLRQVSWLIVIGIAAGTVLSVWAARFIETLLFGLQARDPATLIGASLLLLVVGLGAGWMPARRAAKLNPVAVLRE